MHESNYWLKLQLPQDRAVTLQDILLKLTTVSEQPQESEPGFMGHSMLSCILICRRFYMLFKNFFKHTMTWAIFMAQVT